MALALALPLVACARPASAALAGAVPLRPVGDVREGGQPTPFTLERRAGRLVATVADNQACPDPALALTAERQGDWLVLHLYGRGPRICPAWYLEQRFEADLTEVAGPRARAIVYSVQAEPGTPIVWTDTLAVPQ